MLPLDSTHLGNCNYDHLTSMVPLTWTTVVAFVLTNLPDSNPLLSLPSKGIFWKHEFHQGLVRPVNIHIKPSSLWPTESSIASPSSRPAVLPHLLSLYFPSSWHTGIFFPEVIVIEQLRAWLLDANTNHSNPNLASSSYVTLSNLIFVCMWVWGSGKAYFLIWETVITISHALKAIVLQDMIHASNLGQLFSINNPLPAILPSPTPSHCLYPSFRPAVHLAHSSSPFKHGLLVGLLDYKPNLSSHTTEVHINTKPHRIALTRAVTGLTWNVVKSWNCITWTFSCFQQYHRHTKDHLRGKWQWMIH